MILLQQSPSLRAAFQNQVDKKISANREEFQDNLGNGFLSSFGGAVFDIRQLKNQIKGSMGEEILSLLLQSLPDTWTMFNNALIPAAGKLTEIDHLIVGSGGVFLVEVKTWNGSFSAYKDKWKRRERDKWVAVAKSPTSQSAFHQKMFEQWIASEVPNFPNNAIVAPVIFTVARWVGTTDCSVPVLHGFSALQKMLVNSPNCLSADQVSRISTAIANYTIPTPTATPKPIIKRKKLGDS
jgi:hypothetical protein